jgi:hypothetical protein
MNIVIANTTIHQDPGGRYRLNDLHKAAGHAAKHKPSEWLRSKQIQELVVEIAKAGIPALLSVKGGNVPGTYGCRELVYAYAMWISPLFHLKVIRTYDALVTAPQPVEAKSLACQTPAQYEADRARIEAELERLMHTPILLTPEDYEGGRMRVGRKFYLVAELVRVLDEHGVERKVAEEITGLNNNTIRQHALLGRRRKAVHHE